MAGAARGLGCWLKGNGGALTSLLSSSWRCTAGKLLARSTQAPVPVVSQSQPSLLPAPSARLLSSGPCFTTPILSCNNRVSGGLLKTSTPAVVSTRTKINYSLKKGKPKTVGSVVKRFMRLDWGIWIRPRAGRAKKMWTKSHGRRYRLKQHVFCNKQQSQMLDKMVTDYWKKPRYYVNDPYAPYQRRVNFPKFFAEKPRFLP